MNRVLLILLVVLVTVSPAAAEKLCARVGPAGDMLCVVNGKNGPNWYVFTGCEDILTIDAPETERQVDILSASASGRYLAIISRGGTVQDSGYIPPAGLIMERLRNSKKSWNLSPERALIYAGTRKPSFLRAVFRMVRRRIGYTTNMTPQKRN